MTWPYATIITILIGTAFGALCAISTVPPHEKPRVIYFGQVGSVIANKPGTLTVAPRTEHNDAVPIVYSVPQETLVLRMPFSDTASAKVNENAFPAQLGEIVAGEIVYIVTAPEAPLTAPKFILILTPSDPS